MPDSNYWPDPEVGPPRDLVGYGRHLPKVRWPNGERVVVSLCLNYEEGSERTFAAGDGANENSGETPRSFPAGTRNLSMESVFEYGSRAGVQRLLRMFDDLGVKCTAYAAAVALACNPEAARWMVESGHEICSHGWRWSEQWTMSREQEADHIAKAVDLFQKVCGVKPEGWYSRYGASVNTRELLVEAGFLYDSDAYNDDLPYLTDVGGTDHLVLPYAFDTNDMRFTRNGGFVFGDDFAHYCIDAFDRLYAEGGQAPRMMSVGLHLRIIGRPGRIGGLERFLAHVASKSGVWFARRDQIARHWLEATGRQDILARVLGPTAV